MPDIAQPIRHDTAVWVGTKLRADGTLLLYHDKLVHVSSRLGELGRPLGGELGVAIVMTIARSQAPKKAAAGGKGVAEIPLDSIAAVENLKATGIAGLFGGRHLVVTTSEAIAYRFSGVPDYWIADIAQAMSARGFNVLPTPQGIAVS
jgi:hypothetical protein